MCGALREGRAWFPADDTPDSSDAGVILNMNTIEDDGGGFTKKIVSEVYGKK